MKWSILRSQLLSGVAGHPESFFISHVRPILRIAEPAGTQWRIRALYKSDLSMQFICREGFPKSPLLSMAYSKARLTAAPPEVNLLQQFPAEIRKRQQVFFRETKTGRP